MTDSSKVPHSDVTAIVVERFQGYLNLDTADDLPLTSRLLDDLGIDSIALVTILLDLADQLKLDLGGAQVNLSSVQALADVITLVRSLPNAGATVA